MFLEESSGGTIKWHNQHTRNHLHIITVGAAVDRGTVETLDDVIAEFSSRGPTIDGLTKSDLAAPGVGITSLLAILHICPKRIVVQKVNLRPPCKQKPWENPKTTITDYYVTMSGTSMATPMAAGIAALLLEEYTLFSSEVKCI